MPKPINPARGHCACRVKSCEELAEVKHRKDNQEAARYLVCPVHGRDMPMGPKQQAELDAWIDGQGASPGPEQGKEPGPAPEPEKKAEGPGKGRGFLALANEQLNEMWR